VAHALACSGELQFAALHNSTKSGTIFELSNIVARRKRAIDQAPGSAIAIYKLDPEPRPRNRDAGTGHLDQNMALDNGVASTPPLGWNSWNKFACNVSEDLIRQAADAVVSSGMKDAGYQ
jgi:Alpha galactosidase A